MNHTYKRTFWIIGVVLIAIVGFGIYNSVRFRITSTTPRSSNFPSSLGTMEVSFNKELDVKTMNNQLSDNPQALVKVNFKGGSTTKVGKDRLTITFAETPPAGSYKVTLSNIRAVDGSVLNTVIKLKVKDIPYDRLSDKEQQLYDALSKDADTDVVDEYPLLQKLPHETEQYQISYGTENIDDLNASEHDHGTPTITISMKFFAPGSNASPATPAEQQAYLQDIRTYRKQALDWLQSKGFNLNDYQIHYSEPELQDEFPKGKPLEEITAEDTHLHDEAE